jgi:hypothetical protein
MAVPEGYKTITCYLPPDIAKRLEGYCLENQITRKDKQGELQASWGTGVVEILKVFFNSDTLPSPLLDTLPNDGLSKGEVKDLVEDLVKDSLGSLLPNTLLGNGLSKGEVEDLVKDLVKDSLGSLVSSALPSDGLSEERLKKLEATIAQLQDDLNLVSATVHRLDSKAYFWGEINERIASGEWDEEEKTNVLNHTENTPSEDALEAPLNNIQDENIIQGDEAVLEPISEGEVETVSQSELDGIEEDGEIEAAIATLKAQSKNNMKTIMKGCNKLAKSKGQKGIFPADYYNGTHDAKTILLPAFEAALRGDKKDIVLSVIKEIVG